MSNCGCGTCVKCSAGLPDQTGYDAYYAVDPTPNSPPEPPLWDAPWSQYERYDMQGDSGMHTRGARIVSGREMANWIGADEMAQEEFLDQEAIPGDAQAEAEAVEEDAAPTEEAPSSEPAEPGDAADAAPSDAAEDIPPEMQAAPEASPEDTAEAPAPEEPDVAPSEAVPEDVEQVREAQSAESAAPSPGAPSAPRGFSLPPGPKPGVPAKGPAKGHAAPKGHAAKPLSPAQARAAKAPVPKPLVTAAKKAVVAPKHKRVAETKKKLAKVKFKPVSEKHPGADVLASDFARRGKARRSKNGNVVQMYVRRKDKARFNEISTKAGQKHFVRIGSTFQIGGVEVNVGPAIARRAGGMLEVRYPITCGGKRFVCGEMVDERKITAHMVLDHARKHGVTSHPGHGHGIASGVIEIGFFGSVWRGIKKAAKGVSHAATSSTRAISKAASAVAKHVPGPLKTAASLALKATPYGQAVSAIQRGSAFIQKPSLGTLAALHPAIAEKSAQAWQLGKTLQGYQQLKAVPGLGQAIANNPIGKKLEAIAQLNKLAMSVPGVSTFAKKYVPEVAELEQAARLTQGGLSLKGAAAALQTVAPGSSAAVMAARGATIASKAEQVSSELGLKGMIPGTSGFSEISGAAGPVALVLDAARAFDHAAKIANVIYPGHGVAVAKAAFSARPGSIAQAALLEAAAPVLKQAPGLIARAAVKAHAMSPQTAKLLEAAPMAIVRHAHQAVAHAQQHGQHGHTGADADLSSLGDMGLSGNLGLSDDGVSGAAWGGGLREMAQAARASVLAAQRRSAQGAVFDLRGKPTLVQQLRGMVGRDRRAWLAGRRAKGFVWVHGWSLVTGRAQDAKVKIGASPGQPENISGGGRLVIVGASEPMEPPAKEQLVKDYALVMRRPNVLIFKRHADGRRFALVRRPSGRRQWRAIAVRRVRPRATASGDEVSPGAVLRSGFGRGRVTDTWQAGLASQRYANTDIQTYWGPVAAGPWSFVLADAPEVVDDPIESYYRLGMVEIQAGNRRKRPRAGRAGLKAVSAGGDAVWTEVDWDELTQPAKMVRQQLRPGRPYSTLHKFYLDPGGVLYKRVYTVYDDGSTDSRRFETWRYASRDAASVEQFLRDLKDGHSMSRPVQPAKTRFAMVKLNGRAAYVAQRG